MYECRGCYKRAILEVIYILFVLGQGYYLIKHWLEEWREKECRKIVRAISLNSLVKTV